MADRKGAVENMVRLLITKQDLEFLILAVTNERRQSEEVRVPLCRSEIACLAKLYRARDRAYGRRIGGEWEEELRKAQTFEGMGEAFVERFHRQIVSPVAEKEVEGFLATPVSNRQGNPTPDDTERDQT